ncbi:MAG: AAA domain-containing protein [bacterium]|nr:AAA domain-containing protein [bacterium]
MFNPKVLLQLAKEHQEAFKMLAEVEVILNKRFADLQPTISALCLAAASSEPFLLIGPPGTGKSRLVRAFCSLTGLLVEDDPSQDHPLYFEYLLTPFTEPGELFGFYDIEKAMKGGKLERPAGGMMQHARVVYLDEVFNGSSAILNSLLAFMNERVFHDRNERCRVDMQCLFAATNHVPETPELRAVFDRFLLRCNVYNVESKVDKISRLLSKGWRETYSHHAIDMDFSTLFDRLERFRQRVMEYTTGGYLQPEETHDFYKALTRQVHFARQYELSDLSNRRLVKLVHLMLVHRIYEAVCKGELDKELHLGPAQLELLPLYFLDQPDEEMVQKMRAAANQ